METSIDSASETWPGLIERPARGDGEWPEGVWAVFVHGAMDRGAGMAHLARALGDAPTLRYDRRGYGRATALGTGTLVAHVDDLVDIVGDRPAVLFGHSYGGLVVLSGAASKRLDVRGVATWEVPAPWTEGWGSWAPEDRREAANAPSEFAERFMRSAVGSARWEALPERTRVARRHEGIALLADMDPVLNAGVPFDPTRIDARTVLGAGRLSEAPYVAAAQWLADRVPDARVEIVPDAPHGAPMSRPGVIAAMIRRAAGGTNDAPETSGGADAFAV